MYAKKTVMKAFNAPFLTHCIGDFIFLFVTLFEDGFCWQQNRPYVFEQYNHEDKATNLYFGM